MTSIGEAQFASAYLSLLRNSSTIQLPDDYKPTKKYSVSVLPKLPKPLSKPFEGVQEQLSDGDDKVEVKFKSIRAPKFVITLNDIPAETSIKDLKLMLLEHADVPLKASGFTSTNEIKLVSGGVVSDIKILRNEASKDEGKWKASFSVVLQKSKGGATESSPGPSSVPTDSGPGPSPSPSPSYILNDDLWKDIDALLTRNLGSEPAKVILNKFKGSLDASV